MTLLGIIGWAIALFGWGILIGAVTTGDESLFVTSVIVFGLAIGFQVANLIVLLS